MKRCTKCGILKSILNFSYRNKNKNYRQSRCKECARQDLKEHYRNHKSYYLVKAKRRNKLMRKHARKYVWEYLQSHACVDCGENNPVVLEFDHIAPRYKYVAVLMRNGDLKGVKNEISKCEVRCANCHRKITAQRFNWDKTVETMPL